MRQVLFRIPTQTLFVPGLGDLPLFGWGLMLGLWALVGLAYLLHWRFRSQAPWSGDDSSAAMVWAVISAMIVAAPGFMPAGVPIFGYGCMLFIGFVSATWWASRRAIREGLDSEVVWDLAVWVFVAGITGARLFYLLQYHQRVYAPCVTLQDYVIATVNLSSGGIVLYGGLFGGAAAYFLFCARKGLRPLAMADLITPSVFLGIGFGRIGCLLNGCCWGDRCELPWGLSFPQGSVPYLSMLGRGFLDPEALATPPLHPTQIYSAFDGFLIAALTAAYYPVRRNPGSVLAVALFIYPVTRFLIEFLRGDELGQFGTSLTISQWMSLALWTFNLAFLGFLSLSPARHLPIQRHEPLNSSNP